MGFQIIGGSTATTAREQLTFGTFGLAAASPTAGVGVAGTPVSLGTTTQDIDGLVLSFSSSGSGTTRIYWFNIYLNDVLTVANFPMNLVISAGCGHRFVPVAIPAGTTVKIALSSSSGVALPVSPSGYTSNLDDPVTSISVPGGSTTATIAAQGSSVNLTGTTFTAWTKIGTDALASDAKGLATTHLYTSNDASRTPACDLLYEVGYGPDASTVTTISPLYEVNQSTSEVRSPDGPPLWHAIPSGNFIFFRAKATAACTEPVSCQAPVMF